MTRYTHPSLEGFISPAPFTLGEIRYPRVWWQTVDEQEIASLGFLEYVSPVPEPPTFSELKEAKKADIAHMRWQAEVGGMDFDNLRIPTDRETQAIVDRIVKAYQDKDLDGPVKFKLPQGFFDLTESHLKAIKRAGAQHIQACFRKEADLCEAVEAAADEAELKAIDITTGWPGQSIT